MRITTIMGSPRKHGNTETVLGMFEELAAAVNQVERINIVDYKIGGCLGCDFCHRTWNAPGCVQKDEATILFERLIASDAIIYATPLYAWSFTSQMKAFLDRHYCLIKLTEDGRKAKSLLQGKRAALLVTCGDAAERNADLIQIIFSREMKYAGCEAVGKFIVPECTTPDKLGEKGARAARDMYEEICGEAPAYFI